MQPPYKVVPSQLQMCELAPAGQRYIYASTHPMHAMLEENYFLAAKFRFQIGDCILIMQVVDPALATEPNHVIAFVHALVVEMGKAHLKLHYREEDVVTLREDPLAKPKEPAKVSPKLAKKPAQKPKPRPQPKSEAAPEPVAEEAPLTESEVPAEEEDDVNERLARLKADLPEPAA